MTPNRHPKFFLLTGVLSLLVCGAFQSATAQVAPSANGGNRHIWVGGEYSRFNPDYGLSDLNGIGVYADMNVWNRVGAEAQARFLSFSNPLDLNEKSYMIGPTVRLWRYNQLTVNAKGLIGASTVEFPPGVGHGSYFSYGLGGNAEYQVTTRIKVRGEYEYDVLPAAPGFPGFPSNGLNPRGFSIGASYRVF